MPDTELSPEHVAELYAASGAKITIDYCQGGSASWQTQHSVQMGIFNGVWMVAKLLAKILDERDK
jgi:hypothetical protein